MPVFRGKTGLKPVVEPRLFAQAYQRIRDAILGGRLAPGTPLSRRRLAAEFRTSPLPVSQALQRLEAEGFVESRPRAGTRVRIPSPAEILGHYVVREALETHSARLFAESATAASRRKLLEMARRLDEGYASLDGGGLSRARHERIERLHFQFHARIAAATGCRELRDVIERSHVLLFNWLFTVFVTAGEAHPLPDAWHGRLAEALTLGTPEAAAETMREHVRYRMQDVINSFSRVRRRTAAPDRIVRGPQLRTMARNGMATAAPGAASEQRAQRSRRGRP